MTSVLHLDQASSELYGKRLSLFREFAPRASRVAVLAPASYWRTVYGDALRDAAERLGFTIVGERVEDKSGAIERTFARIAAEHADLLVIPDLAENNAHLQRIVELSVREKLPRWLRPVCTSQPGPDVVRGRSRRSGAACSCLPRSYLER
jgi:hypothetical protein